MRLHFYISLHDLRTDLSCGRVIDTVWASLCQPGKALCSSFLAPQTPPRHLQALGQTSMHLYILLNNFCLMLVCLYHAHAMDGVRDSIILCGDAGGDFLDFQGPLLPAQLRFDKIGVCDHPVDATDDATDTIALSSDSRCHDLDLHGLLLLLYILRQPQLRC